MIILRIAIFALPYACLIFFLWRGMAPLKGLDRRTVLLAGAASLAGSLVWALAIHQNPWAGDSLFYHLDDASYDRWGRNISQRWKQGEHPELNRDFEIGTLHTGYYRFVAAIYYVFGPAPMLVIFLNMLAGAALPAALYFLAREISGAEAARRSAWLAALYPNFWHFNAFMLRDAWITLFFVAILALLLQQCRSPGFSRAAAGAWLCLAAFGLQMFLLRYYLLAILLAGWGLYELALGPRRKPAAIAAAVVLALAVLARFQPGLAHLQDRMFQSFTWAIPSHLETLGPVAPRFAKGLIKLFLAPFAWATEGGYTIDYFLWPGQWMMYALLLPFGLWGAARVARRGPKQGFMLLFPFIAGAYGFCVAYEGSVPRQRMFLDVLLIVFASMSLGPASEPGRPPRRYLIAYYCALGLFIAAHVIWRFIPRGP